MARTGDAGGGQWLTYAEAGQRFGVSQEAARQLARRRGWPRRTPNEPNEPARILVPDDAYVRPRTPVNGGDRAVDHPIPTGDDQPAEHGAQAFEIAITALATQLDRSDERARQERERADRLERKLEEMAVDLADARTAERIAAGEVAALRAEIDKRQAWSLWRRLRWAIRQWRDQP
jgi:hypothetical protein